MIPRDLSSLDSSLRELNAGLQRIAPSIANHLWQSTAFIAAVWVLALLLRRNSAQVRFGLWLTASAKLLLPFSLLIALGSMLPHPHHPVVTMPVYSAVDTAGLPFDEAPSRFTAPIVAASLAQIETPAPVFTLPLALWLCGGAVVVMRWFAGWHRVARIRRSAITVKDGREIAILRRLERETSWGRRQRPIPLLLAAGSMEPGVLGVFRPVVIWPEELSAELDNEQIAAILAHELMHVRRQDNLAAALHMLVQAAFWFHPAVWWIGRQMVAERELACDEAVVELGNRRGAYAEGLLKAVRFCVESPLPCAAGITGADLKKRVHAIMRGRLERLGWARKAALVMVGVVAIAAPVAFGMLRMIPLYGQVLHATGPLPSYEVVVIKPSQNGANGAGTEGEQTHYLVTTKMLIQFAYGVFAPPKMNNLNVVGGPDWINTDVFDIVGKTSAADFELRQKMNRAKGHEQRQLMEQSLLADRFKLKMHIEMQDQPVLALTVIKSGKLTPAKDATGGAHVNPNPSSSSPEELKRGLIVNRTSSGFVMTVKGMDLDTLIDALMSQKEIVGKPVVNQTGLTGAFDFTLTWGPEEAAASDSIDAVEPSLFTAIQQQLGLKLVNAKAPAEVVVIDHIEKPVFDSTKAASAPAQSPRLVNAAMVEQSPVATAPSTIRQTQAAQPRDPEFAVSTVKPTNAATSDSSGISTGHGRLDGQNVTLERAIIGAYGVGPHQVIGGPEWVNTLRWDIEAKADQNINDDAVMNVMLAQLLAERFKLVLHKETRTIPAYVLEVDKSGPKFKKGEGGDSNTDMRTGGAGRVTLKVSNTDMDLFAAVLARKIDLPVVNETGLKGVFNFELAWTPDDTKAADGPDALSIFTAIQELGLRLRRAEAPVEVQVIDHAEMPSAN